MATKIIVGTRKSRLALAQTQIVVDRLSQAFPHASFVVQTISTSGDDVDSAQMLRMIGKGVFVKEIESALLRRRIDLAVHSLKDMPTELPAGLRLGAVLERQDGGDVYIGRAPIPLKELPNGARIGTNSLRRRAFLSRDLSGIVIEELRGNLDTRISKLAEPGNTLAGIVVAAAGVRRLYPGNFKHYVEPIPTDVLPPAPGQGILAIESRVGDKRVDKLLAAINHEPTFACALAERSILRQLEGGCNVPIAALAQMQGGLVKLTCWISNLDGTRVIQESALGAPEDAEHVASALEVVLKGHGASDLIEEIRIQVPWARSQASVNGQVSKETSKMARKSR